MPTYLDSKLELMMKNSAKEEEEAIETASEAAEVVAVEEEATEVALEEVTEVASEEATDQEVAIEVEEERSFNTTSRLSQLYEESSLYR
jgi:DNA polymerase II large subunit